MHQIRSAPISYEAKHGGNSLRLIATIAAALILLQPAHAESHASLAQSPGCIAPTDADPGLAPDALVLGVLDCVSEANYPNAAQLFVLIGLRGAFDTRRVIDTSAHRAVSALSTRIADAISLDELTILRQTLVDLGGNGSPWHTGFCELQASKPPPEYEPQYMLDFSAAYRNAPENALHHDFDAR